jgi:thiol-disulfide isomerase/thioredoxin
MALELSLRPVIALLLIALAAGGCDRRSSAPEQANETSNTLEAPATATNTAEAPPLAGQVDRSHKGEGAPEAAFKDPAGKSVALADFKGKPLILNLWATWCVPCIREMPALDTMAGDTPKVQVVAVSQDLDGMDKVRPFFDAHGFKNLQPYIDKDTLLSTGFGANLPLTVLYDSNGKEVWRVAGGMDWTSAKARALVAEAS